jgi:hypothetical protein
MLSVNRLAGGSVWAEVLPPELIAAYVLLGAGLILGGAVVLWVARRFRWPRADNLTREEQLARFRALKEQGALSPEEFERVRTLLESGAPPDAQPPGPKDTPRPERPAPSGGDAPVS